MIALNPKRWARRLAPLMVLVLLVAACSTGVAGESWAGFSTSPDGKSVFLAYQDKVFRLNTDGSSAAGGTRWGYQIPGGAHSYAPPSLSATSLFVGGYDGKVYGFDQATGQPLPGWNSINTGDKIIGGTAYDSATNLVYSPTGAKGLGAFDPKNGTEVAHFDGTQYGIWAAPLVVGNTVYAASLDHFLYALDSKTLALKWKLDLGGALGDTPTYDGGHMLYIGTFNSEMLAIDVSGTTNGSPAAVGTPSAAGTAAATSAATAPSTPASTAVATVSATVTSVPTAASTAVASPTAGTLPTAGNGQPKIVNRFKAANWVWSSPIFDNGTLYFGDLNGILYAVDATSFKLLWQAQDKVNSGGIRGRVAVVDNFQPPASANTTVKRVVLVGSESKRIYAYDADTGAQVWVSALVLNDRILSNLVVIGQEVLFTTVNEDQLLVALNIQTGQIEWQTKLSDLVATLIPTPHP